MSSVSVREVAERAGVSIGTVSNVLNRPEVVSPEATARVKTAIKELGYVRNDAARLLRAGRSKTIGLIVLDVGNPFFTDVARGSQDEASSRGLTVVLGNSDGGRDLEEAYLHLFEEQRVHGVLITPRDEVDERLNRLRARGTPAVLVDRVSPTGSVSSVAVDDVAGGRLAIEHLVSSGRRDIAFVGGPVSLRQVAERLDGASRAAAQLGASLEVIYTGGLSVIEGRRVGEMIAARPPRERPSALFAANDFTAIGLLQGLAAGSVRVPHEVAVMGYDDIDFASSAVVPLSSIRQPARLMGETAVRLLMDEAADPGSAPKNVIFQPELVGRESTAGTRTDSATSG